MIRHNISNVSLLISAGSSATFPQRIAFSVEMVEEDMGIRCGMSGKQVLPGDDVRARGSKERRSTTTKYDKFKVPPWMLERLSCSSLLRGQAAICANFEVHCPVGSCSVLLRSKDVFEQSGFYPTKCPSCGCYLSWDSCHECSLVYCWHSRSLNCADRSLELSDVGVRFQSSGICFQHSISSIPSMEIRLLYI